MTTVGDSQVIDSEPGDTVEVPRVRTSEKSEFLIHHELLDGDNGGERGSGGFARDRVYHERE